MSSNRGSGCRGGSADAGPQGGARGGRVLGGIYKQGKQAVVSNFDQYVIPTAWVATGATEIEVAGAAWQMLVPRVVEMALGTVCSLGLIEAGMGGSGAAKLAVCLYVMVCELSRLTTQQVVNMLHRDCSSAPAVAVAGGRLLGTCASALLL